MCTGSAIWSAAARKAPAEQQLDPLRTAMALWQGEPLAGVPGGWAEQLRGRLVEERLAACADWAMAEVSAGNAADVLATVGDLADAHPLVESLTLATMEALLALDRPTEALERCRTHRRRLAEEFGTDQGVALRERYQEVLRADAPPRQSRVIRKVHQRGLRRRRPLSCRLNPGLHRQGSSSRPSWTPS